ncbi:molecular chaperone HtpG [Alginatibacterium sediminis]|uniref:Chaperone protein HtpG n=1 Tax=Alginatibacterium sediminis TaxID=2164068 RepID=A0A420EI28_9ALTE|nr:molecular chaperone HtpG [Alginatibacterium sediminis]RKF20343.1 molecular chaperone HtpG [Alginatibacterium sediminis]
MTQEQHTEKHGFTAEVSQLLKLMIHSLYSNKEIFLRELVSNAADAADKLRFKALEDSSLFEDDGDLRVRVSFDKDKRQVILSDNGIGMTRDQVIEHLGTIAKSGTKEFFGKLSGDEAKDSQLIGQFGVGFYSAFIVADKVTVETRAAGTEVSQGVRWVSAGEGDYEVSDIEKTGRGTDVILHLRDEEDEFLDNWKLRSIITKYSDHISIPVEMYKEEQPERDGPDGPEGEKIPAVPGEWEAINKATALWTRTKNDISDEEYNEFYKHISHDFADPLQWSHNKVEGKQDYTSLLYIPAKAPWDMWNRERQHGLKLYVQRVFIMDDADQFMPSYLRFVKGVLDSNDLPLNVSREILQDTKVTSNLRSACTKRVLTMLERMAKNNAEKYQGFWEEFGQVLKEGPAEDAANKDQIAKLLRFASTHTDSKDQTVGFADYVERMGESQDKIYYVSADSYAAAANNPHLEIFKKKGIEVVLMYDRIDEWLISHLSEFDGKQLVSVSKGSLDLGELDDEETKAEQEKAETEFASFVERAKTAMGDKVKDVRLTHRLIDTPSCIVSDDNDMSTQMQKLMEAAGQAVPEQKYIFELNPQHPMVAKLSDEQDEAVFADWIELLHQQAELSERGSLEDPSDFIRRVNRLLV